MAIRDPEFFRGMTPDQMLAQLLLDSADDRHTQTRATGKACVRCMDTGMEGDSFCGCGAGGTLALQSNARGKQSPL